MSDPEVPSRLRAVNHWSVGLTLIGAIMWMSPALSQLGITASAVGAVFYARRNGRIPLWALPCLLPVIGALVVLIVLTILPAAEKPAQAPIWRKILYHPAPWALPILAAGFLAWSTSNPSITMYRAAAHDRVAREELEKASEKQAAYFIDHHAYADSLEKLVADPYHYMPEMGVVLTVTRADAVNYEMNAFHPKGRNVFVLTGPDGEIRKKPR